MLEFLIFSQWAKNKPELVTLVQMWNLFFKVDERWDLVDAVACGRLWVTHFDQNDPSSVAVIVNVFQGSQDTQGTPVFFAI